MSNNPPPPCPPGYHWESINNGFGTVSWNRVADGQKSMYLGYVVDQSVAYIRQNYVSGQTVLVNGYVVYN